MSEAERLEQRLGVQRLLDAEAKWGDTMLALNRSTPMKLDAASYLIRLISSDFHDHSLLVLHPGQHESKFPREASSRAGQAKLVRSHSELA